jgi:hypothetical protein
MPFNPAFHLKPQLSAVVALGKRKNGCATFRQHNRTMWFNKFFVAPRNTTSYSTSTSLSVPFQFLWLSSCVFNKQLKQVLRIEKYLRWISSSRSNVIMNLSNRAKGMMETNKLEPSSFCSFRRWLIARRRKKKENV